MLKFIKYDRTSLGWEEVSLGDGEMERDLTSLCFLIVVHFRIEHTHHHSHLVILLLGVIQGLATATYPRKSDDQYSLKSYTPTFLFIYFYNQF